MYADGNIIVICEKDFHSPGFRVGVKEIINLKSQECFTPEEAFGV